MPLNRLDLEARAADIRERIAALQVELGELVHTINFLRKLEGLPPEFEEGATPSVSTPPTHAGTPGQDLIRSKTADAAAAVMSSDMSAEWNFSDVAIIARRRGYSPRPGSSEKAFRNSFRSKMSKLSSIFIPVGNRSGAYKLDWSKTIEAALAAMRTKPKADWSAAEVAAAAKRNGYLEGFDVDGLFRMAMESAPEHFEQIGGSGIFRLVPKK